MAWTEFGGELLRFEATKIHGKGTFTLTGQLGEIMQESAQAAFSFVRGKIYELDIARDLHRNSDIHIHVPEGSTPKEGPSAGITIATAIISLLTDIPVSKKVAMTGEITLKGKVLPVGGIKEKLLAAFREGLREAIVPRDNEPDLKDLPKVLETGHDHPPRRDDGRRPEVLPDPRAAEEALREPRRDGPRGRAAGRPDNGGRCGQRAAPDQLTTVF